MARLFQHSGTLKRPPHQYDPIIILQKGSHVSRFNVGQKLASSSGGMGVRRRCSKFSASLCRIGDPDRPLPIFKVYLSPCSPAAPSGHRRRRVRRPCSASLLACTVARSRLPELISPTPIRSCSATPASLTLCHHQQLIEIPQSSRFPRVLRPTPCGSSAPRAPIVRYLA